MVKILLFNERCVIPWQIFFVIWGATTILTMKKFSVKAASVGSLSSSIYYLMQYGYVQKRSLTSNQTQPLFSKRGLQIAIRKFQAFAGLNQTGEMDPPTVEMMNTPRCGVKDVIGLQVNSKRHRRFAIQGSRWRKKILTYRIGKYPARNGNDKTLKPGQIDREIKAALNVWSNITELKFEYRKSGPVNIEVRFETGEHGDGDSFDGPGGTLAHAFFPQFGGDVHFDDTEYWTINKYTGINLRQTAAHEFGHSLGLSHSNVRSALMAPFYSGWDGTPEIETDIDDIEAIQTLYGKPVPKIVSLPEISIEICNTSVDAVFSTKRDEYYVFKGHKYWKLTDESIAPGYPKNIVDDWTGLVNDVDAAVTWPYTMKTYFFKGSKFWKFDGQIPQDGYPKDIKSGFPGIPNHIDAAFIWSGNGKMYFFKNNLYWKYDPSQDPPVHVRYPRSISNWGFSSPISSAVLWSNGFTYFFQGNQYYRFNDREFGIDEDADPKFPRPIGPWWFGCSFEEPNT